MNNSEQYRALQEITPQIEKMLGDNSFEGIKELILWLAHSTSYNKLKGKENSLIALDAFCKIWMEEKKDFFVKNDIFSNVKSLNDIQKKYRDIHYAVLRIENQLPAEYCSQSVNRLIEEKVSGIAIVEIAIRETLYINTNIIKISEYLMNNYELPLAIEMLQYAQKKGPNFKDFVLKEAEGWICAKEWNMALESLEKISDPDDTTKDVMNELRLVIANEKIQH